MAGYVLYFPGKQGADPAILDVAGLGALARDGNVEFGYLDRGAPDLLATGEGIGRGAMCRFATGNPTRDADLSPVERKWKRLPIAAEVYVGVEVARPLMPDDVARKKFRKGHWARMNDGNEWHIPVATSLPHVHGLRVDGEHERRVADEWRDVWELSQTFAAEFLTIIGAYWMAAAEGETLPDVEVPCPVSFDFCCRMVSINYQIAPPIISALELVDDDAMCNIIKCSIDLPILLGCTNKKKDSIAIPVS